MIKHFFGEKIYIIWFLPLVAFNIVPMIVYRMRDWRFYLKMQISLHSIFLLSDGISTMIFTNEGLIQDDLYNNLEAQLITFTVKLVVLLIYIWMA